MKILYAIQGTGNGHVSRASEFIPLFKEYGDVDVAISGNNMDMTPDYPVSYHLNGLSYVIGKHGGIDLLNSARNISFRKYFREIRDFPVRKYDLVINDFEPVTARAAMRAGVPCAALSHQAAFLSQNAPRPSNRNLAAELIFRHYAPAHHAVGLHYRKYDTGIFTPLIRSAVRELDSTDHGHVTVYLPSCDTQWLFDHFKSIRGVRFQVFSRKCKRAHSLGNLDVLPVSGSAYLKSLSTCTGLITGAGFEAPSEALYLGKKLMVIPMKNQYEQKCNAVALEEMGVQVEWGIKHDFTRRVTEWLEQSGSIRMDYHDNKHEIVEYILSLCNTPVIESSKVMLSAVPQQSTSW